jgi:hypothetical protein
VKAIIAIVLLAVVPSALASHPSKRIETQRNLDRDRALERIVGEEEVTRDHSVWRASVRVLDRCGGRARTLNVVRGYTTLESVSPVQADGRGPAEVIGVVTNVARNRGMARLVRLAARRGRCPALRTLFRYVAADTIPPQPGLALQRFEITMHQFEIETPERELSVSEYFRVPSGDALVHRSTRYRYVRADERYHAYSTVTHGEP